MSRTTVTHDGHGSLMATVSDLAEARRRRVDTDPEDIRFFTYRAARWTRWMVRGWRGAVTVTAVKRQHGDPEAFEDERGVIIQPESVWIHSGRPLPGWPHVHVCDIVPTCYGGPYAHGDAVLLLNEWAANDYRDQIIQDSLTALYRRFLGDRLGDAS